MTKPIDNAIIESISRILADTMTGSKITTMFKHLSYSDFDIINNRNTSTKWRRLNETISYECYQSKTGTPLLKVIEYIMNPQKFVENPAEFQAIQIAINGNLLFYGYELTDTGKIVKTKAVHTLNEAQERLKSFKDKLKDFHLHNEIYKYCKTELFNDNYYHATFEASKGLFQRIRTLSECTGDGTTLIRKAFDETSPKILIKGNLLSNPDEKSQYIGAKSLMISIVNLYRNPKAHIPKLYDPTSEKDAITAFVMISLAHSILDNCINVRDIN